ncbi:unnamed protein product [Hydatigera taeniaeformis]|uniref:Uncharacterized protein n=1 Tax=Hydatigena taeniaeformis TaxID=6205 RepID=A0A0R3WW59_HYDTA|nr:unnamed protein product [Hydatigera taeniaeformis]
MDPNARSTCSALLQLLYFEKVRNPDSATKVPSLQVDVPDEAPVQRPLSNEITPSVICLDGLSLQNPSGRGKRSEKAAGQMSDPQSTVTESHDRNPPTHHTFVRADQRKLTGSTYSLANKGAAMKFQPAAFPWLGGSCAQLNRRSGGDPRHNPSPNLATVNPRPDLQSTQLLPRFQGSTLTNAGMPLRGGALTPAWSTVHRTPSAGPKH